MHGVINMNDEHLKTAQDVKIDKMAQDIGELIIEGSKLKSRLDHIDRNQPIVDGQFEWLYLWIVQLANRPH